MNTDRSLSAFAGRFVPLKLTTSAESDEWQTWARKYSVDGNGIPFLYVVRADGEQLYGKSGALPGDALPQMLASTLQQSGRGFNDAEVALLETSLAQAKEAIAAENHLQAAAALGNLRQLGAPGELKSHSKLAMEADLLVAQVTTAAEERLESVKAKLDDPQTAFDGVLGLIESEQAYAGFPELSKSVVASLREVKRNDELKSALNQTEALMRARKLAASDKAAVRNKAASAYELVITRFPDTPGAQLAREELAAIDPDAEALTAEPDTPTDTPADEFRKWTAAAGGFSVEAEYVQQKRGFVQLKKRDGSLISVEIKKLSPADQTFLAKQ